MLTCDLVTLEKRKEIVADDTQNINCPKCLRTFKLTEHNADGIPSEKESYNCPYSPCDYSITQRSAGYFSTDKIQTAGKYITEGQILNALLDASAPYLINTLVKKLSKIKGYKKVTTAIINSCKTPKPDDAANFKKCILTKLKLQSLMKLDKKNK